jgi:hypothetical protein
MALIYVATVTGGTQFASHMTIRRWGNGWGNARTAFTI